MFLFLLLVLSVSFSNASILSTTYNDPSCASNSRIAFHYDSRENIGCSPVGCSAVGDGNFYDVRCDILLSSLDNSVFATINYYDTMDNCNADTAIMAYGGILNSNAVNIYHATTNGWMSVQFIFIDTAQFTMCNVTDNIPTCTSQFVPLSCTSNLNLDAGSYWKFTAPTSTPVEAPIDSPISSPFSTNESPNGPLPEVPIQAPVDAPVFVDTPIASNDITPEVVPLSDRLDVIRCNCTDLAACQCHMSCQMVDDVVKCSLG